MDRISDLEFFLVLSRHKTLKAASLELGLTGSAVSQRLSALEGRLGVTLLKRTGRTVFLTAEGCRYAEEGKKVLERFRDLEESVRNVKEANEGKIRVNASFGLGRKLVAPLLSSFRRAHPNISLELVLTDKPADLIADRFDLCIWAGTSMFAPCVAKKLADNRQVFCASPEFLVKVPEIKTLEDLANIDAVGLVEDEDAEGIVRVFNAGKSKLVKMRRYLLTNDGEVALRWCLDGLGVLMRSQWSIRSYVESGKLKILLPQWTRSAAIYAFYPDRTLLNRRTALLIEYLQKKMPLIIENPDEKFDSLSLKSDG